MKVAEACVRLTPGRTNWTEAQPVRWPMNYQRKGWKSGGHRAENTPIDMRGWCRSRLRPSYATAHFWRRRIEFGILGGRAVKTLGRTFFFLGYVRWLCLEGWKGKGVGEKLGEQRKFLEFFWKLNVHCGRSLVGNMNIYEFTWILTNFYLTEWGEICFLPDCKKKSR